MKSILEKIPYWTDKYGVAGNKGEEFYSYFSIKFIFKATILYRYAEATMGFYPNKRVFCASKFEHNNTINYYDNFFIYIVQ